jgi:hypothetical protein
MILHYQLFHYDHGCVLAFQVSSEIFRTEQGVRFCVKFSEQDVEGIFGGLPTDGSALVPSSVHLPKVDSPNHVTEFAELMLQVHAYLQPIQRFVNLQLQRQGCCRLERY